MASSQHRCVFVGNIPYDATEEQLIEICREVGPVVSFRLVTDRETGKPKGYGFCEYKDEETALSARRNLQGYVINGRQLRVDFAENDKGSDRNREQGRGGPGMATTIDTQKQLGSTAVHGEGLQNHPIGLHLAISAAAFMQGAIGGAPSNQNGVQSAANDPLTLHLAKMSRNQLNEILSEMKKMATQNKDQARQLLLARPQLLKAIFQAQIMLGLVPPQMISSQQGVGQVTQSSLQDIHRNQQPNLQTHPGLPPLAQKLNSSLMPNAQENQVSAPQNQFSALLQPTLHPRIYLPQHTNNPVFSQVAQSGTSVAPRLLSATPSVRPQVHVSHSSLNQQVQHPMFQQGQLVTAGVGQSSQMVLPIPGRQSPALTRSSLLDSVQVGSLVNPVLVEKRSMVHDSSKAIGHPTKMVKLDDTRTSFSIEGVNVPDISGSGLVRAFVGDSAHLSQIPRAGQMQRIEKPTSQQQLPPEMESALLQQVLNLTPEQLNSLSPEQRQQVIQLQQALCRDQLQPS